MALEIHSGHICLPLQNEFLVSTYDKAQGSWQNMQLVQCSNVGSTNSPEDLIVQCCSFSPCGRFLAVCLSKYLTIYNAGTWNLVCSIKTERKGISVRFFPKSSTILLAEKSGSVKFFKFSEDKIEKLDLCLGHNSMLIDALITDDERFIITCDRDEKIRVTNYPNVYNIQCYCLGHLQFISCINVLLTDGRGLVSSSGDGTIRFWNIKTGKELLKYGHESLQCKISSNNQFFVKIVSFKMDQQQSLVAALECNSNSITILKVEGNVEKGLMYDVYKKVDHISTPWDISFWQGTLVSLVSEENCPLKLQNCKNESTSNLDMFNDLSQYIIQNWNLLLLSYKRKFDALPLLFQYKKDYDDTPYQEIKKIKCK